MLFLILVLCVFFRYPPANLICEFLGGLNLVQAPGTVVKAQTPIDVSKYPITYLYDNEWPTLPKYGNYACTN